MTTLRDWLTDHSACEDAVEWLDTLPEPTLQAAWEACPRGDWLLWVHARAGTEPEVLAPVVYGAINRALRYTASALDNAGVQHKLGGIVVKDAAGVRAAEDAAKNAWAAAGAASAAGRAADNTAWAAWAAVSGRAAPGAAWGAAEAAAWAAWVGKPEIAFWDGPGDAVTAREAEHLRCAEDCRRLLPLPVLNLEGENA